MHRVIRDDFGFEEPGARHADTFDLTEVYIAPFEKALFVATDIRTREVLATFAAKRWDRHRPLHPDWLHEWYQSLPAVGLLR
jgi:hypothetical protein